MSWDLWIVQMIARHAERVIVVVYGCLFLFAFALAKIASVVTPKFQGRREAPDSCLPVGGAGAASPLEELKRRQELDAALAVPLAPIHGLVTYERVPLKLVKR